MAGARLTLAAVVLSVASCGGGLSHAPPRRPKPMEAPPSVAVVQVAPGVTLPEVTSMNDDARLVGLREKERSKDFEGAARLLSDARARAAASPEATCAWAYAEGRFAALAGNHPTAQKAYDAVVQASEAQSSGCGLAAYARLRAAQAAARSGQWDAVIAYAKAIPEDFLLSSERAVAEGEAYFAKGDRAAGAALLRKMLAKEPMGPRWVDSSAKVAGALVDGLLGEPREGAREAYELATRILISAPKFADVHNAAQLRARAAELLKDPSMPAPLKPEERAKEVQGWLDSGDAPRAAKEAEAAFREVKAPPCKLAIVRAQALAKTKQPSDVAWGDAITLCDAEPELATALYGGGKASSSKKPDEARARFQKLEERFPKNRLADDARLLGAILSRDAGDDAKFSQMLLTMPDDYPEGDMRAEALFRVALERMRKGDYAGALVPLERTLSLGLPARHTAVARASYFLGRVAEEAGERDTAKKRYERVITDFPLTFPMLLAYRRLAEQQGGSAAERAFEAAQELGGDAPPPAAPSLDPGGVSRAARLMEVGEIDAAKRELARAGLKEGGELSAAFGRLFSKVGAFDVGVALARKTDLLAHYPNGRWRAAWEATYPRAFDDLVRAEAKKNGIPVSLAFGIMREESMFVVDAKSVANAFGLMQLILPTAKLVAQGTGLPFDETGLKRADVNVALGTRLLGQLRGSLGEARAFAPSAYNAGAGAVGRWRNERRGESFDLFVEAIPYEETRNYQKRVLQSQAAYAFLYDRGELRELFELPLRAP